MKKKILSIIMVVITIFILASLQSSAIRLPKIAKIGLPEEYKVKIKFSPETMKYEVKWPEKQAK
jgi:hypothetical protein